MREIICPHCNKAFKIDEAGYANILKQARDGDFEMQLHERLALAEREKRDAIALAEAKLANALQSAAARKDAEIQALQAQLAAAEVRLQAGGDGGFGRGQQRARWGDSAAAVYEGAVIDQDGG